MCVLKNVVAVTVSIGNVSGIYVVVVVAVSQRYSGIVVDKWSSVGQTIVQSNESWFGAGKCQETSKDNLKFI